MTEYAKQVLMIFIPWQDQSLLDWDNLHILQHFRHICQTTQLKPEHQIMLQNIQDCYNSLSCPMPPDPYDSLGLGAWTSVVD